MKIDAGILELALPKKVSEPPTFFTAAVRATRLNIRRMGSW